MRIVRGLAWGLMLIGVVGCGATRGPSAVPQPLTETLVPSAGASETATVDLYDLGNDKEIVLNGRNFSTRGAYTAYWTDRRTGRPLPIAEFPSTIAVKPDGTALFEGVFASRGRGEIVVYYHPDGDPTTLSDMRPVLRLTLPEALFR